LIASELVNCSIARALGEVGERWSLLIIREAIMGSTRFDEFHERLGVARNILNDRLSSLLRNGVMTRKPSPDNARIHHYLLTEKGLELLPVLAALMHWGDRWIHADIGPPVVLIDRKTRKPIRKVEIFEQTGRPLKRDDIEITAGPGATAIMRKRLSRALRARRTGERLERPRSQAEMTALGQSIGRKSTRPLG
jgi:DNA-binding HxlR family transcriptional regulator